ncbi:MAG: glycine cleavage system aminomethyltransferase GcvT [Gammaproteobacteria bacterium]
MEKKTVLNQSHRDMGARMVSFGGWDMPVHYGSQIDEHNAVREHAGMFDVSHMQIIDIHGSDSTRFLRRLLANDVARLKEPGKALYSCMLNPDGGVIDDLIVYFCDETWYRLVVNAATADKDIAWIMQQMHDFEIQVQPRPELAMIAVQGPKAIELTISQMNEELGKACKRLKPFSATWDASWFIGRTGYTGEDGFEIMLPEADAPDLWKALAEAGVAPCGLGARDTLRLEAGMNLYGQDMDETTTPLVSGLGWTVAMEPAGRDFIGRDALEKQKNEGIPQKLVGLLLEGRGVLRGHQQLHAGDECVGEITSGGFSPTLQRSIGLARISADAPQDLEVDIRGQRLPVRIVKYPFVRHGQACIEL